MKWTCGVAGWQVWYVKFVFLFKLQWILRISGVHVSKVRAKPQNPIPPLSLRSVIKHTVQCMYTFQKVPTCTVLCTPSCVLITQLLSPCFPAALDVTYLLPYITARGDVMLNDVYIVKHHPWTHLYVMFPSSVIQNEFITPRWESSPVTMTFSDVPDSEWLSVLFCTPSLGSLGRCRCRWWRMTVFFPKAPQMCDSPPVIMLHDQSPNNGLPTDKI